LNPGPFSSVGNGIGPSKILQHTVDKRKNLQNSQKQLLAAHFNPKNSTLKIKVDFKPTK
jgi:hypothetical protein